MSLINFEFWCLVWKMKFHYILLLILFGQLCCALYIFYTLQKKGGSCMKKLCIFGKPKLKIVLFYIWAIIHGGKLFGISYSKNMANFIKPKPLISEECLYHFQICVPYNSWLILRRRKITFVVSGFSFSKRALCISI